MKLLDIGANDRSLKTYLDASLNFPVAYKSMDVDRSHEHDFYSLDEIQESFDAIGCFEVVEHMTPGMALEMFRRAHHLLTPKGRMFVSTPNVYHPMSFWSDSTHIYAVSHPPSRGLDGDRRLFKLLGLPRVQSKLEAEMALLALSRTAQTPEPRFCSRNFGCR